jgi:hypothetical protein
MKGIKMNIYDLFKDFLLPSSAIIISIIALIRSSFYSKKSLQQQVLTQLIKDYNTVEMGESVKLLWEFYEKECKGDKGILIDKYCDHYNNPINNGNVLTLHFHRRRVSQFYQLFASYFFEKLIDPKVVKRVWSKDSLSIIDLILKPIETEAIPRITNKEGCKIRFKLLEDFLKRF